MRGPYFKLMAFVLLWPCAFALHAQTLTFNLTGTILPGTCRWSVADVDLGTYNATLFTGSYTTNWVDVPVSSSGCDPLVTTVHMRVTGNADVANAALFRGIAGIGIELQVKPNGAAIVPAGTTVNWNAASGGASYLYQARFRQSAATVASGTVRSPVTMNITYN
jgi:type 1 fimbria pilin